MSVPGAPPVLALAAASLRAQLPELVLRPGMLLAARVLERGGPDGRHGVITLAGAALVAELPDEVRAGDALRLQVSDLAGDRVVLRLVPEAPPPEVSALAGLPLPDGRRAQLRVDEPARPGRPGEGSARVAVTYASPTLGDVAFVLELDPGGARARVEMRAGAPQAQGQAGAEVLREALARVTGRPARVDVVARREPLDLYV